MSGCRLIIFTRYPEPGEVKRRLISTLGPQGAADLQRAMTAHTLCWAGQLPEIDVEVRFAGGDRQRMQETFGTALPCRAQGNGDLGRRMAEAFDDAFAAGASRVVIVGSDCPDLDGSLVAAAFDRLARTEVVLGPAADGGYYLIGLRQKVPELFEAMPWGTGEVLERTLQTAGRLGLAAARLPMLVDVDRPADLAVWNRVQESSVLERISIIIPTLNEADILAETLEPLLSSLGVETIVVDGGSVDETVEIAGAGGARVLVSRAGRARQMNAGAAAASGSILLFLHADTRLPHGFEDHVRQTLGRPGVVAGGFAFRIRNARGWLRLIERVTNLRARYLRMPYGDQAIFLRREVFERLGGFAELPIMEDYEFMRRLRRQGRIGLADAAAVTSARRWQALGPLRTTWINQMIVLGYHLGVSADRLARWYGRRRIGRERSTVFPRGFE